MEQTDWPSNTNPILTVLKEEIAGDTDKWGTNLMFLFSLCDIAVDYGVPVPGELEFRQGMGGSDTDADHYRSIEGLLSPDMYIHKPLSMERFCDSIAHALKVCGRYDRLLRLAGEDY